MVNMMALTQPWAVNMTKEFGHTETSPSHVPQNPTTLFRTTSGQTPAL
jgi:hypothetical protein